MKKYKLTDETIEFAFKTLHRIKALRDFGYVKAGDLGGFIEKEDNLSHEGNCWVGDNARVCGKTEVNAKVYGDAVVYDNARVFGGAKIFDNAKVFGNAIIGSRASIFGNAKIFGDARIFGDAEITGNTKISIMDPLF
ncbi:hypothetical protein [Bartonella massiliensis]|uniref:hypothetical protein n=1 Tax=Bartonella massiliensis TaxID=929795 RepID=UPI001157BA9C|nr:hypothetical protein [Bartonella massiliensis]